jgi:hypothetical protein
MTRYVCSSADAMQNLLLLQLSIELCLVLETDQRLVVADEIQRGRCNVQTLILTNKLQWYGSCQSSS